MTFVRSDEKTYPNDSSQYNVKLRLPLAHKGRNLNSKVLVEPRLPLVRHRLEGSSIKIITQGLARRWARLASSAGREANSKTKDDGALDAIL